MSAHRKYLVTTQEESGRIVRVELLGDAGELVEVPLERFGLSELRDAGPDRLTDELRGIPTPPMPITAADRAHPAE